MRRRIGPFCSEGIMVQRVASSQADNDGQPVDPLDRVSRLSQGQVDCLLLVNQHHSSKEIAVRLGISSHTVDQRIRGALEKLGVERRGEAARIVAAAFSPSGEAYQRLIHQSPHIDVQPASEHQEAAVSHQIRHADRAGEASPSGVITEQRSVGLGSPLQLPFATRSHPSNEMSVGLRLLWIVLIAIGATFSAGMYLAGLESLSRMISN
ncbi:helix-turn-helix domain-containing protein [Sphingomonas edaphi]|jgi:DNA-binding CsgD family transcriptional regulator|uniref:LuxR family transcriptional regulator n=1 Tax=Sphingomonas edaphi TaxID=2315689 RepID=A0A418Q2X1_9SPHN|nr:helix-turn-helix transcriptional regulator [Sphingomonas edaphi]RIX32170.1 LuxR family transcriptional regulator [Sphingomonas edaphi]